MRNQFNKKKAGKSINSILLIIFIVLIILTVVVMVYYYHKQFSNNGFSDSTSDWGNFGSYLGSVTGLLAFAGVLLSVSLSEKRAFKAEQESIKREERDLFFKMLELLKDHSKEVVYTKDRLLYEHTEDKKGILAFDSYVININKRLISEIIKKFITRLDEESFKKFIDVCNDDTLQNFELYQLIKDCILSIYPVNYDPFSKLQLQDIDIYDLIKKLNDTEYSYIPFYIDRIDINRDFLEELYSKSGFKLDNQKIYESITTVANYIFSNNGTKLEGYCNTFKEMLEIIAKFSDTKKYYSILASQLTRNQLVVLFLYSFSKFSNVTFVNNFIDSFVLEKLHYSDIIILDDKKFNDKDIFRIEINGIYGKYIINYKDEN